MISHDVRKELDGMPPGTHAVLVYDTEERKQDALFTHLKVGDRYDDLIYVCSEETPTEAEAAMRRFGFEVDERKRERSLEVKNYDEVYIINGKVNSRAIIKSFSDRTYDDIQRGYGMRASAEMSCFFDQRKVRQLVKYENDLHRRFSFPAMGLCGYSLVKMVNSGNLEVFWPIIYAHALVVMTGPNGSFALKPEEIDTRDVEKTMGAPKGTIPKN